MKNSASPDLSPVRLSLAKRVLFGAAIGFILIAFFLYMGSVSLSHPEWGKYWMLKPMIFVPIAGATGGYCSYIIMRYRQMLGFNKNVAGMVSAIIFIIGLWMGMLLGLDGTLWD